MALVKFVRGTKPASLTGLDNDTIYFFDDGTIYLGSTPYGGDMSDLESDLEALQSWKTTADTDLKDLKAWKQSHSLEYNALVAADEDFEERISALEDAFENAGDGAYESLEDLIDAVKTIQDSYVKSVTAGDGSVTVTTGQTPTVKVNISDESDNLLELKDDGLFLKIEGLDEDGLKDYTVKVEAATTATEGFAKTYEIKQGAEGEQVVVGKIDIPKDLVLSSGTVEVNADDSHQGTWIKLVLNNEDVIWIAASDLVDTVSANNAEGAPVTITVTDGTKIGATLGEGKVDKKYLASGVQTTLDHADEVYTALTWGTL